MFNYSQATGILTHDGAEIGQGYSGHDAGKDNPALQDVHNVGPLPQGLWSIGAPEDRTGTLGPFVMPLSPVAGTETFGRSGFFIHGDSSAHPLEASHGCLIFSRGIREQIAASGDNLLQVTA